MYTHFAQEPKLANENAVHEVESIIRMENAMRVRLGLKV
jgi:hypothetical protein